MPYATQNIYQWCCAPACENGGLEGKGFYRGGEGKKGSGEGREEIEDRSCRGHGKRGETGDKRAFAEAEIEKKNQTNRRKRPKVDVVIWRGRCRDLAWNAVICISTPETIPNRPRTTTTRHQRTEFGPEPPPHQHNQP